MPVSLPPALSAPHGSHTYVMGGSQMRGVVPQPQGGGGPRSLPAAGGGPPLRPVQAPQAPRSLPATGRPVQPPTQASNVAVQGRQSAQEFLLRGFDATERSQFLQVVAIQIPNPNCCKGFEDWA